MIILQNTDSVSYLKKQKCFINIYKKAHVVKKKYIFKTVKYVQFCRHTQIYQPPASAP